LRSAVQIRQARSGWLFLAPGLGLIGVFFFLPVIAGLLLSLTDFDIYAIGSPSTARFVGLHNYADVLSNPVFWQALVNTLYFVVAGGLLSVAVSLGAALQLSARVVRLRSLFRTIYFAPVVTTLVAVAIVWRYL
jgi:multiple sugar transport system permease protein